GHHPRLTGGFVSSEHESLTGSVGEDFPEYETPPADPMDLVRRWTAEAVDGGVREPMALALATVDRAGHPSNRMVAVSEVSPRGLLFATHSTSRKGRDIAETGWASGLLYWRETARQLSLSGPVTPLEEAENDRLWEGRAIPLHSMTVASRQSDPLDDPERLLAEAERLDREAPLPRPE